MILLLLSALFSPAKSQYFGGGCGGCPQPMCAPRPACAPPPPPVICPPPAPCPPQFCPAPPPPPICPPPPPPVVCPPPPPPSPCQIARPMYYQVAYPSYGGGCGQQAPLPMPAIPAQNDCCCGCSSPCRYKGRARKAAGVKTIDPACNSEDMRKIIEESISNDASESKRIIQVRAEQTLAHMVNVICGKGEFSYIAHTETFCQATRNDITCYAFKPI